MGIRRVVLPVITTVAASSSSSYLPPNHGTTAFHRPAAPSVSAHKRRRTIERAHYGATTDEASSSSSSSSTHAPTTPRRSSQLLPTWSPSDDEFTALPRHLSSSGVNRMLEQTEDLLRSLHEEAKEKKEYGMSEDRVVEGGEGGSERVYSNHYVDMGKVDTVGFDYDYTLVTYTPQLLDLIYSMALQNLVTNSLYPSAMLQNPDLTFSPTFPVRGLAVDRENGWICHLSYTHKVAVAFEGRVRVTGERLDEEYRGKRSLTPRERKERLKPLNDLFSMAECCLIADVIQFFRDEGIPFCPRNAVDDVLGAIGATHVSGDFHRIVAEEPARYFEPRPHLEGVLRDLKEDGKRLILVSNSPFWYVDAGMRHVIGEDWKEVWEAIIVSAGKPKFYTEDRRPFRMVDETSGQISFKKITRIEPGKVYCEGCLKELTKCIEWSQKKKPNTNGTPPPHPSSTSSLTSSNVLYIGDSLFADLVDAKRDFGWTTAAVIPEVASETELQRRDPFTNSQTVIDLLLETLRRIQAEMGPAERSPADVEVLDELERTVSRRREEQNKMLGNPFGSIFRAQYQPSLFAHSLRRYCDLYMSNVSDLRHYSSQHRFYPDDARLLSHEVEKVGVECWDVFEESG